jgi:transposase
VTSGTFPDSVPARVCWGPGVKSLALLLAQRAHLPTQASVDTLAAMGIELSKGCLDQWRKSLASTLADRFAPRLRAALLAQEWLGVDETPINVTGMGSAYAHVATNGRLVQYHLGTRSLESSKSGGIIGAYTGTVVSDCYGSYFSDDAGIDTHQLCCAHLVRELKWVDEVYRPEAADGAHPQPWAAQLVEVLGRAMGGAATLGVTRREYRRLVGIGLASVDATATPYSRERDTRNLLTRLQTYEDEVLGFMTRSGKAIGTPPTNNAAEQSVKPVKVRQRRSGCFRSREGAEQFLTIQSYLRSANAHGVGPLEAITRALGQDPWLADLG